MWLKQNVKVHEIIIKKRSIIKRKVEIELKIQLNIQLDNITMAILRWQYYDGNITMVRQINKIFVYKQVYFMYAL